MAATMTPAVPFGNGEWSNDWNVVQGQNQGSWGTWEAPVQSPLRKSSLSLPTKALPVVQPPAPVPSASFVPVTSGADGWAPATVAPLKPGQLLPVPVQSPPSVPSSAFIDVTLDNNAWNVVAPIAPAVPDAPIASPVVPVLHSPQRSIKLRQNGNIEAELRQQDLYKTEYCRSWRETGACRYGSKCQFAHGEHELRPVLRHPKYKTEVCRNYAETGTCPYGTRCRFVHYQRGTRHSVAVAPSNVETQAEEVAAMSSQMSAMSISAPNLAALADQPPIAEQQKEKTKGSRLPFFQKLRRQTSGDKEKK